MSDLVERLRLGVDVDWSESILDEAADRIKKQDKRIAELEAERDEWKAKYEWCCQKLKIAAESNL